MLTVPIAAHAQSAATGRITGRVVAAQAGEPISQATVSVSGTSLRTITDLDGRYIITNVPIGVTEVVIRRIGYGMKTITGVEVFEGETRTLNVSLDPVALALEAITVTAAAEDGSAAAVLDRRRRAEAVFEAVGSMEIRQIPATDAADVAQRMTGVTVASDRYVYVRGLGERYSQTSLNGSPLPSPEPEREVVPLDLFPSDFLEGIATQKTYTPDQWGEFSGGTVQIQTKEFPDRFQGSIGVGTGLNTQTHFKDDAFLSYPGGDRDFLGVDDGTRGLPQQVEDLLGGLRGQRVPSDPTIRQQLGMGFQRVFNPRPQTAPIDRSFDLSLGTRTDVLGKEIGFLAGVTYSDDYTVREDEIERKFRTSSFDPDLPEERRAPNVDYVFTRGLRTVRLGGIGNLTFLLSPTHKIGVRATFNRNTDDEARTYSGLNNEDIGGLVRSDRLRFISRALYWGQVSGEHQLFLSSRLEWRGTLGRATRDEPGLREAIYLNSTLSDSSAPYYLDNVGESARYLYSELEDDDKSAELDWEFPLTVWAGLPASIKFGGAFRERDRDFAARRFKWQFIRGIVTDIEEDLVDENIVGNLPGLRQFAIDEVVEPGDQYLAFDDRRAGYLMVDLPFTERLRVIMGARVETYDLHIESRGDTLSGLDDTDILPAVNLVYEINGNMNFRAAVSRTADRPEFRELAPFQFTEASSLRQIFGNPELRATKILSYDVRWDWFPGPGELFSVSGFYKQLDQPIEQVFIAAASTAYSYQNADDARLYGVEFDVRKRLDILTPALQDFVFRGNLSLVNSNVTVVESGTFQPTNLERPLEGQSGYSVNLGLVYQSPLHATELGVFYNRFGDRLTAAGGFGVPDIYEKSRNQLDVNIKQQVLHGLRAKLKATNLLNEPVRFEQEANGIARIQREYKQGIGLSVGLSYEF